MTTQPAAPSEATTNDAPQQVSAEEYMEGYAESFYEWVDGKLVKMSPVSAKHVQLSHYFIKLFETYFAVNPIGQAASAPFVMRLDTVNVRREPDVQVILGDNQDNLSETYMSGPADIVIEIVSPSNAETDYGRKLIEYEGGGVPEYWLIDGLRRRALFHRLGADGLYTTAELGSDGQYRTERLPGFTLPVVVLWQLVLPNALEVVEHVQRTWERK